jgi:chromate transporter
VPDWSTVNLAAVLLTIGAVVAVFRFKAGTLAVLATCAGIGIALRLGGIA